MSLVEMTSLVFLGIPRYKVKDDVSWITKVVVESIESREEDAEKLFIHFNQQTLTLILLLNYLSLRHFRWWYVTADDDNNTPKTEEKKNTNQCGAKSFVVTKQFTNGNELQGNGMKEMLT